MSVTEHAMLLKGSYAAPCKLKSETDASRTAKPVPALIHLLCKSSRPPTPEGMQQGYCSQLQPFCLSVRTLVDSFEQSGAISSPWHHAGTANAALLHAIQP